MTWSFSALSHYETCPYRRKLAIDGYKEVESEAILKGHNIHTLAENCLKGGEPIPEAIQPWAAVLTELRGQPMDVEQLWGLDRNWQPVDWRSPACWLRIKLDVCVKGAPVRVIDWKSGKKNPVKHAMQGNLYVIAAKACYPGAPGGYRYEFYYLNDSPLISRAFSPESIESFKLSYERRATKMLEDKALLPRPHKTNCKFCGYHTHCPYSAYEDAA